MLTKDEIAQKKTELGGDALYLRSKGEQWEVILIPPTLPNWEAYLFNRESPANKTAALYVLVRTMVGYAGPGAGGDAKATFDQLRTRWVSIVEAIGKSTAFDSFVGLTVVEEEKA